MSSQRSQQPITSFFKRKIVPNETSTPSSSTETEETSLDSISNNTSQESACLENDTNNEGLNLEQDRQEENKKKTVRKQKFSSSWLEMPIFQGWLEPVEHDKLKAKCKACNIIIGAKKSDLVNHAKSKRHIEKSKAILNVRSLASTFKTQEQQDLERRQIFADLRYHISFRTIDHLTEVSNK